MAGTPIETLGHGSRRARPLRVAASRTAALSLVVIGAVVGFATPALGEEPPVPAALRTAAKHASLAVGAQALPEVKMHLHHVLNCLEGPKGQDYDAKGGDPCGGKGALEALPAGSANRVRAEKAIELARVGVTFHDLQPAHDTAQAVQAVLEEAVPPARTGAGAR